MHRLLLLAVLPILGCAQPTRTSVNAEENRVTMNTPETHNATASAIPALDREQPSKFETATFALG